MKISFYVLCDAYNNQFIYQHLWKLVSIFQHVAE